MFSNLTNYAQHAGDNHVYATLHFTANGTDAPLTSTIKGDQIVASFAYTPDGILTVTFKESVVRVLHASAQVDNASAVNLRAETEVVTEGGSGAAVVKIRCYKRTDGTAVSPGTARISLFCVFQNGADRSTTS